MVRERRKICILTKWKTCVFVLKKNSKINILKRPMEGRKKHPLGAYQLVHSHYSFLSVLIPSVQAWMTPSIFWQDFIWSKPVRYAGTPGNSLKEHLDGIIFCLCSILLLYSRDQRVEKLWNKKLSSLTVKEMGFLLQGIHIKSFQNSIDNVVTKLS